MKSQVIHESKNPNEKQVLQKMHMQIPLVCLHELSLRSQNYKTNSYTKKEGNSH